GRANYEDWSKRLGVDLVSNPELTVRPDIAARIAVVGMRDGTFTSRSLSTYINNNKKDFYNARGIINGDKGHIHNGNKESNGHIIERYAQEFLKALEESEQKK
nr:peptidoglycan-binding protein [Pyrinomonadaceae bacterium]